MDQTVTFAGRSMPAWPAVRDLLQQHGFPVQMRMIDNQLAFPDELPPDDWSELRLGTPQGMVTVRRSGDQVAFVVWGNADAALRQAWNALVWAWTEAGGGQVLTPEGAVTAADYRRSAELPPGLGLPQ
jgi:hypothetical protein